MPEEQASLAGPDLAQGVALSDFTGETLLGHVGDQDVLLVRSGPETFAIGARCSHYHGPLAERIVVGDSIRCPWHHACFDLRTGEATRAPALTALAVWQVEHEGDRIFVRQKREQPKPRSKGPVETPGKIVIVGGGAVGFAAAEMLRRRENIPMSTANLGDGFVALKDGKMITIRIPYPLSFYAKGFDGRIDDPNAGWKGRGLWSTNGDRTPWLKEGGKVCVPKIQFGVDLASRRRKLAS